jgi:hypothetical protein
MNQVSESEENVAKHRKAVAELERDGQDAGLARKMLKDAEHVQTTSLAEKHRLQRILSEKSAVEDRHAPRPSKTAWQLQNLRCSATLLYPASTYHRGTATRGGIGHNATIL